MRIIDSVSLGPLRIRVMKNLSSYVRWEAFYISEKRTLAPTNVIERHDGVVEFRVPRLLMSRIITIIDTLSFPSRSTDCAMSSQENSRGFSCDYDASVT